MSSNPDDFGAACGGSRWFKGEPVVKKKAMRPIEVTWPCPMEGCDGEMQYAGWSWPTFHPGYHHTCTRCKFTAAVHRRYPHTTHEAIP